MKKYLYAAMFLTMFLNSCRTELLGVKIETVGYGTSLAQCVGYCRNQIFINKDSIHFTTFCDACMTPNTARKDYYSLPTKQEWDSLQTYISINSFFNLATVIGCPNCAEGSAEWLEISLNNGEKHKVTFEYNNEPTDLKLYIPILKRILNENSIKVK